MSYLRNSIIGLAIASILVVILFTLSSATSADLIVERPGGNDQEVVTLPRALVATVTSCTVASIVALVLKLTIKNKSRLALLVLGIGFTALSLASPLVASADGETAAWLISFHLAVAIPTLMCLSAALTRPL